MFLQENYLYTAYDYKNVNWDAINHDLNCTNWSNLYADCNNSNDFWNSFANYIIYSCDLYIPCSIRKSEIIIIKVDNLVIYGNF